MASQADLDYYSYWVTVYSSPLPFFQQQARFIRDIIQITEWQVCGAVDCSSAVRLRQAPDCRG